MNQPLSFIHKDAKIGANVIVEPFSYIAQDVQIGEGTWIGPNVTIMDGARIGKNCRIFPGAVISAIPQDLKFRGEITTAEVGDNTTLRECVTVNRGTASKGRTIVGSNNLLMAYVHVAHDCVVGSNCIIGNTTQLAGEVEIDDWAILSSTVLVHQFVHIGSHVIISGGSLVRMDVPPYVKAAREPLSYAGLNTVGLRRRNFSDENIKTIQQIYRFLYQEGRNTTNAIAKIESEVVECKAKSDVLDFIKRSTRGLMKGVHQSSSSVE